jgi:hypothetical protein
MCSQQTSPLHLESLPRELAEELKKLELKLKLLPIPEFATHTIITMSGEELRTHFSAHLNGRNHACGALMGMLALPESKREPAAWFSTLGILQREDQYLHTIVEHYNRVHAK